METGPSTPEAGSGLPLALHTCLTAARRVGAFLVDALTGPAGPSFYRQTHDILQLKAEQTGAVQAAGRLVSQQPAETAILRGQINDILGEQDF